MVRREVLSDRLRPGVARFYLGQDSDGPYYDVLTEAEAVFVAYGDPSDPTSPPFVLPVSNVRAREFLRADLLQDLARRGLGSDPGAVELVDAVVDHLYGPQAGRSPKDPTERAQRPETPDLSRCDVPGPERPGPGKRPRGRLTTRGVMIAAAALAVSLPMVSGLGGLISFAHDVEVERAYRDEAYALGRHGHWQLAADSRAEAEEVARRSWEGLLHGAVTLGLVVLGVVLGALGRAPRIRTRTGVGFAAACTAASAVLLTGFAFAVAEYAAFRWLVAISVD